MSDDQESPISSDCGVGYGRPPVEHQFPPGVSGNRKGRPRKPKGDTLLNDLLLKEASRKVKVRDGDKVISMTFVDAVIRQLLLAAIKGDAKAMAEFLKRFEAAEASRIDDGNGGLANVVVYLPDNGRG